MDNLNYPDDLKSFCDEAIRCCSPTKDYILRSIPKEQRKGISQSFEKMLIMALEMGFNNGYLYAVAEYQLNMKKEKMNENKKL
jgi:hypothetical protein